MYTDFFNLRRDPFRLTPEPELSFAHPSYAKAMAYLEYGLRQGEGFVVVTGRPGSGKTTLMRALLQAHRQDRLISAALVHTRFPAADLAGMVAHAFGLSVDGADRVAALDRLRRFLEQQHQRGNRALLIIDEAQGLSAAALKELYVLSSLDHQGRPLLQVFLLGQEQLRGIIQEAGTEQLRQRLIAACHLEPLDAEQTEAYVRHRLTDCGWRDDPRFDPRLFGLIQHFSEGLPRRINTVCSRLLLYGAVNEQHELAPRDLIRVIEELREERLYAPGASAPEEPAPALEVAPELDIPPEPAFPAQPDLAETPDLPPPVREPAPPVLDTAAEAPLTDPFVSEPSEAGEPARDNPRRPQPPAPSRSGRIARALGLTLAGAAGGVALLLAYERFEPDLSGWQEPAAPDGQVADGSPPPKQPLLTASAKPAERLPQPADAEASEDAAAEEDPAAPVAAGDPPATAAPEAEPPPAASGISPQGSAGTAESAPAAETAGAPGTAAPTPSAPQTENATPDPAAVASWTPAPEDTASDSRRSRQVRELLARAEAALEDYRLTTPPDDSALHYYRAVLELDPENVAARLGFEEIAYTYVLLARNALSKGRSDLARLYVRRGLTVDPRHPELRAMER